MLNKASETLRFPDQNEMGEPAWRRFLVGESPAVLQLCEIIKLIASKKVTVLISGETGTGKEVVARAIHAASNRVNSSMVAVNCTALPASLVESELFGHAKGAFTGAHLSRLGRFEQAHRGTIFLDEIGDLPLEAQAKLLRVLQEQEFERVGSSETVRVDVRVIAASNVDLEKAAADRKFREDLYYRLNVVPIHLSPLRERRSDIPLLLQHFLQKIGSADCSIPKQISDEAVEYLTAQEWPGNIRQLEHTVQMACALSGDRLVLCPRDFVARGRVAPPVCVPAPVEMTRPLVTVGQDGIDFDQVVEEFERSLVSQALAVSGGNKARAADLLRIKRTTLLAKMKVFDDRDADAPAGPIRVKPAIPISKPAALLIEPDGPVRKLLARTLEKEGFRILETASGETAVDLFDCWKSQIKLLITSGEAGCGSKDDFIGRIRKASPALPVIVLTDQDGMYSASTNGARTEVLLRPFSPDDLYSALQRLNGSASEEISELQFACA